MSAPQARWHVREALRLYLAEFGSDGNGYDAASFFDFVYATLEECGADLPGLQPAHFYEIRAKELRDAQRRRSAEPEATEPPAIRADVVGLSKALVPFAPMPSAPPRLDAGALLYGLGFVGAGILDYHLRNVRGAEAAANAAASTASARKKPKKKRQKQLRRSK